MFAAFWLLAGFVLIAFGIRLVLKVAYARRWLDRLRACRQRHLAQYHKTMPVGAVPFYTWHHPAADLLDRLDERLALSEKVLESHRWQMALSGTAAILCFAIALLV
jgi:hypothetical protein